MTELGQLVDPADVPVLTVDADQFSLVRDDEDPVTRDPWRIDASDVEFPLPLSGDQIERNHTPTLANCDDLATVDHRVGVNVVERRHGGADAGPLKCVLPDHSTVFVTIGVQLAR